jgi:hypothetical protein
MCQCCSALPQCCSAAVLQPPHERCQCCQCCQCSTPHALAHLSTSCSRCHVSSAMALWPVRPEGCTRSQKNSSEATCCSCTCACWSCSCCCCCCCSCSCCCMCCSYRGLPEQGARLSAGAGRSMPRGTALDRVQELCRVDVAAWCAGSRHAEVRMCWQRGVLAAGMLRCACAGSRHAEVRMCWQQAC